MRNYNNYLITGGAGFIGSNFIQYFFSQNHHAHIINVDTLTYAGNIQNLAQFQDNPRYSFEQVDICNFKKIQSIFERCEIDCIIHFAAESHVDRSIENPRTFLDTNIIGTYTLLEIARQYWGENAQDKLFYHVSTDEVYGSLGNNGYFYENTPYDPQSPYSASKASSDHLVRSYANTYKIPTMISNCSNNYGPMQHEEKLIPVVIKNILNEQKIPVYGKGLNIRDWLYVENHCDAIYTLIHNANINETYNIGGDNEIENINLVNIICENIAHRHNKDKDFYKSLISFVEDRKGHDFRYAINCEKIKSLTDWYPRTDFTQGIAQTISWYLNKWT